MILHKNQAVKGAFAVPQLYQIPRHRPAEGHFLRKRPRAPVPEKKAGQRLGLAKGGGTARLPMALARLSIGILHGASR